MKEGVEDEEREGGCRRMQEETTSNTLDVQDEKWVEISLL